MRVVGHSILLLQAMSVMGLMNVSTMKHPSKESEQGQNR